MSKRLLLEWIAMSDKDLQDQLYQMRNTTASSFRDQLKIALKEQDRDTRHACAEAVLKCESRPFGSQRLINVIDAEGGCMNCDRGLPEEL